MATELGVAYLSIAASTGQLAKDVKGSLGGVESSMASSGKRSGGLFSAGFKGAMGVLGGLAVVGKAAQFLADANAEARESAKVSAITENAIKQTGGAANVTAEQVGDLATAISNKTGVDDEAVQSAANLLLTFKNVRNEAGKGNQVFDRATAAAQDLAAAGFGDANGAAKMLGKALNDPVRGITALGRAGVTFTDQQKAQIKAMVAAGDTLGAQRIIMGEVESQVGGAAAATATAADKLTVKWGNFKEMIGTTFVVPMIDKLADMLSPAIDLMSDAVPKVREFFESFNNIGGGGGLGALSGIVTLMSPLKLVFEAVAPILPQLAAAFAGLGSQVAATLLPALTQLSPIIQQVVTVLSGGLQQVILALLPVLTQVASAVLPVFAQVLAAVVPVVAQLVQAFLPLLPILASLVASLLPPLASLITSLLPAIMPLVSAVLGVYQALLPLVGVFIQLVQAIIPPLMAVIASLVPVISQVVSEIAGALVPVFESVGELITALMPTISGLVGALGSIITAAAPVVSAIVGGLVVAIGALIKWVAGAATGVIKFVTGAVKGIGGFASAVSAKIGEVIGWFSGLKDRILGNLRSAGSWLVSTGVNLLKGLWRGVSDTVGWLTSQIGNAMQGVINSVKRAFGIASPSKVFRGIGKFVTEGLALGITDNASAAVSAIDKVADKVLAAAGKGKAAKKLAKAAKVILASQKKITDSIWAAGSDAGVAAMLGGRSGTMADYATAREALADRIKTERDALKSLEDSRDSLRDQVASNITGELDLVSAMQSASRVQNSDAAGNVWYTSSSGFSGIAASVRSLASKAMEFAGKLKQLIQAGFPAALVQEIAGYGTTNGIAVADSLLSASKTEQGALISDFSALTEWSANAGSYVAEQMFGVGIAAQQGVVNGLLANDAQLEAAATELSNRLVAAVKKKLKIKSPSRVFRDEVGLMVAKGTAQGIARGSGLVADAGRAMLDPSIISGGSDDAAAVPAQAVFSEGAVALLYRLFSLGASATNAATGQQLRYATAGGF